MEPEKSIFSVFYQDATRNEKQLIICVCLLCSFFSMGVIGLPVWFKEPEFFCSSNLNSTVVCEESEYCLLYTLFIIEKTLIDFYYFKEMIWI